MSRIVVNVSTDSWTVGQQRLCESLNKFGERPLIWSNAFPPGCPPHRTRGILAARSEHECVPYAFKAYALKQAAQQGFNQLLWADSCIVAIRALDPIWRHVEEHGVWLSLNGYTNYQWTARDAYADLFAYEYGADTQASLRECKAMNREIPHVVATTFAIDTTHEKGAAFLAEYYRLASQTRAFCGPWGNSAAPKQAGRNTDRPYGYCGSEDVLGHRHDQTAASVIAWRLGVPLTAAPKFFAYEGGQTEETILVARGQ